MNTIKRARDNAIEAGDEFWANRIKARRRLPPKEDYESLLCRLKKGDNIRKELRTYFQSRDTPPGRVSDRRDPSAESNLGEGKNRKTIGRQVAPAPSTSRSLGTSSGLAERIDRLISPSGVFWLLILLLVIVLGVLVYYLFANMPAGSTSVFVRLPAPTEQAAPRIMDGSQAYYYNTTIIYNNTIVQPEHTITEQVVRERMVDTAGNVLRCNTPECR